jgi:hypothetical protein
LTQIALAACFDAFWGENGWKSGLFGKSDFLFLGVGLVVKCGGFGACGGMVMSNPPGNVLPYQTPGGLGLHSPQRFVSANGRAIATLVLVGLGIIFSAAAVWTLLGQINLLHRLEAQQPLAPGEAQANDRRVNLVGAAAGLPVLAGMVIWMVWVHRAYRNLPVLTGRPTKFTPGWAVGYFLIPFVNLARIPQVMMELWNESDPEGPSGNGLVLSWWICWIIGGVVARVAAALKDSAMAAAKPSIESLVSMSWAFVGYHIAVAVAGLLAMWIIWGINERQGRKSVLMGAN